MTSFLNLVSLFSRGEPPGAKSVILLTTCSTAGSRGLKLKLNVADRLLLFNVSTLHLNNILHNNDTAMTSFNYYNAMVSATWDFEYLIGPNLVGLKFSRP